MTTNDADSIRWPADFTPAQCPIHVTNELTAPVPVDRVWAWLIRPTQDGCHILTEEVQRGFKSRLGAVIWPTRMSDRSPGTE